MKPIQRITSCPRLALLGLAISGLTLVGCSNSEPSGDAQTKKPTPAAQPTDMAKTTETPSRTRSTPPTTPKPNDRLLASTPKGAGTPGTLSFATKFHDMGVVPDVRPVDHSFAFTNTGGEPLTIERVKTSCGCTTAKASADTIAPGESGTIDVTYEPRGAGQHSYRVTVMTDNGDETKLEFKANVDAFVSMEPKRVEMEAVKLGETHKRLVTFACHDPNMTIDNLRVRNKNLTTKVVSDDLAGGTPSAERPGRSVIEVTLDDQAPWGEARATIVVDIKGTPTDGEAPIEHVVYLPFEATVFDEIHASPTTYRLGVLKPNQTVDQRIHVFHANGAAFDIINVDLESSNADGLSARFVPSEEAEGGYDLLIDGTLKDHEGPVNGKVVFTTSVNPGIQRELRFSGIVR